MIESTFSLPGHDLTCQQGTYEDFSADGEVAESGIYEVAEQLTGRSTWWCSCGERGSGPNAETAREIGGHLGVDEDGDRIETRS